MLLLRYKLYFVHFCLHFLLEFLDFSDFFILNVAKPDGLLDHFDHKTSDVGLKSVPVKRLANGYTIREGLRIICIVASYCEKPLVLLS